MASPFKNRLQVAPEGKDPEKAAQAAGALREARRKGGGEGCTIRVPSLELPSGAAEALEAVLDEFANGRPVVISTQPPTGNEELTTTEAARELRISRPTLINLLEEGRIGHRMVGSHRRVPRSEVEAYREEAERSVEAARARRRRRLQALREMAEITDAAEEGY